MKPVVRQRARIARVRRIQHGLAASAAAEAAEQVQLLETNRAKLARMRGELRPSAGPTTGAALARMGELAMRLDSARIGLGRSIDNARSVALARESERVVARRDQESAEKLRKAAHEAAEALAERRPLRSGRPRGRLVDEGEPR
jgi:hypothetical protein